MSSDQASRGGHTGGKGQKTAKARSRQGTHLGGAHSVGNYRSTTHYILSSLTPYTEANLKLSFKPGAFFNDLEKLAKHKASRDAVKMCYYRSLKNDLIQLDSSGTPRLSEKGLAQLKRYEPTKLQGAASILVIFDIPEQERQARQRLRALLRELRFIQVQKSVWQTEYNVLDYLIPELHTQHLHEYVQVYESARIV